MAMEMDTIKAIQVFIEVAERESFTQAADHLNLSRAMVSRYVEYLEQRFAVRLLQRNTRKVTLTLAGEQALVHCRAMLRQQQELYALSSEQQLQGTIRLTMGQFLFDLYFKQILIQFRQQYPQIRIDLLITEEIVDLYDQRIDLAFRISQKFAEGLIAFPLKDIASVLCASPQFLHGHSLQHPQQLIDVPCLVHQAIGRHNTWVLSAE
jgi:DNA-binding transcriptional LysR family regulator